MRNFAIGSMQKLQTGFYLLGDGLLPKVNVQSCSACSVVPEKQLVFHSAY
jgi:hypothetical protein